MDLTFSDQETAFRDEFRGWLADNPPAPQPDDTPTRRSTSGARTGSASSTTAAGPRRPGRPSTAAAGRR